MPLPNNKTTAMNIWQQAMPAASKQKKQKPAFLLFLPYKFPLNLGPNLHCPHTNHPSAIEQE